jgi:hypothetical protein
LTVGAPKTQSLCFTTQGDDEPLITLNISAEGCEQPLRALLDSGASNNFVRHRSLEVAKLEFVERIIPSTRMTVRLATGATVHMKKRVVGIHYTFEGRQLDDDFIVLDLDDKFDVILGMPWLRKHEPLVNWKRRSVRVDADPPSGGAPTSSVADAHFEARTICGSDGPTIARLAKSSADITSVSVTDTGAQTATEGEDSVCMSSCKSRVAQVTGGASPPGPETARTGPACVA